MSSLLSHCSDLASPNLTNFGISLFIVLGILVSYLAQHARLISRRSSAGISPYFVLLGTTSCNAAVANILVLPASRADWACCTDISPFGCFAALLGVLQIGLQWTCFSVILLLFLLFFPHATGGLAHPLTPTHTYRTALTVTAVCVVHAFTTAIVSVAMVVWYPQHLEAYAGVLGVLAAGLAAVQYLPQLYTTWKLETVGSLSIPMMCLQTPGSFVWAASLMVRYGWAGWSTWGLLVVTGCLQGSVLALGGFYELSARRKAGWAAIVPDRDSDAEVDGEEDGGGPDERTPLVGNER